MEDWKKYSFGSQIISIFEHIYIKWCELGVKGPLDLIRFTSYRTSYSILRVIRLLKAQIICVLIISNRGSSNTNTRQINRFRFNGLRHQRLLFIDMRNY